MTKAGRAVARRSRMRMRIQPLLVLPDASPERLDDGEARSIPEKTTSQTATDTVIVDSPRVSRPRAFRNVTPQSCDGAARTNGVDGLSAQGPKPRLITPADSLWATPLSPGRPWRTYGHPSLHDRTFGSPACAARGIASRAEARAQ